MEHPGKVLGQTLKSRNIKQIELAVRAGISKAHLSAIIKGKRPISARMAILFEQYLGISAKYWIGLQAEYDLQLENNKSTEVVTEEQINRKFPNLSIVSRFVKAVVMMPKEISERLSEPIKYPPITTPKLGKEGIWPYADADNESYK